MRNVLSVEYNRCFIMSGIIGRRGYVFVVDKFSLPVHRSRGFCAVKHPRNAWGSSGRTGLYADLLGIRPGDLVFLYHRRIDESPKERGYRGLYEVKSRPFRDTRKISWNKHSVLGECLACGSPHPENMTDSGPYTCKENKCGAEIPQGQHILPNRIEIEPIEYYPEPVDDNTAYVDHTDPGYLWTKLFRKTYGRGTERSAAPILPEEAEKLERLLERENGGTEPVPEPEKYPDYSDCERLTPDLSDGPNPPYEHSIQAWIMANIDQEVPVLNEVIGPLEELEWFGNEIMYGIGRSKVDILLFHKRDGARYKATVIELKEGEVSSSNINQIDRYAYWIAQLATANVSPPVTELELQPVLIGSGLSSDAASRLRSRESDNITIPYSHGHSRSSARPDCEVNIREPVALSHDVDLEGNTIDFGEAMTNRSLDDF